MRTPPSTRTKDDANKELHEIELKINLEKTKLESITQQRTDAEAGFAAREQKCNNIEVICAHKVNNLDEIVSVKEKEIKHLDNKIASKTDTLESLKNDEKVAIGTYKEEKKHREKVLKDLSDSIENLEKDMVNLDRNTVDKNTKIEELRDEIMSLEAKKDEVIKETTMALSLLEEKRGKLESREIELEKTKSNIRTISVRLHQRYGSAMSEFEIKQTTI